MKTIIVPVCNVCNKPHFGREKSEDRCWCDMSGNYTVKEIPKEEPDFTGASDEVGITNER